MHPVSAVFLAAIRASHTAVARLDAWRGGELIADDLPVIGGEVTIDTGSKVRRTLSVTIAPQPGLWDVLAPIGTELRPRRGVRYPSGDIEWVHLGRFDVDVQKMGYSPTGDLQLTAPDRWAKVQRARFETPVAAASAQLIRDEVARLAREPIAGATSTVTATSAATVGKVVWERDRDAAIEAMARSIGAEAFFDIDGNVVVRDLPTLDNPAVWLVDASATGVLLNAERERNRQRTYNVVAAATEEVNGVAPFNPVTVADVDAASPTFVGGPFGRVPYFYTSPLLRSTAQATRAAQTILERVRGLAAQLTLESVVNPALDAGDVIDVLLPPEQGEARPVERHIIDKVTVPLTVDGSQSIDTRSSRADDTEE